MDEQATTEGDFSERRRILQLISHEGRFFVELEGTDTAILKVGDTFTWTVTNTKVRLTFKIEEVGQ